MSVSRTSDITSEDKELLEQMILKWRPNSKNYEDSWGYVIQATRYGGFKWYDPHTNTLVFFGQKSDADPTLVVPCFTATPKKLQQVVVRMQKVLKAPQTILKNIDKNDVDKYLPLGFRFYKKSEKWNALAKFDDQTYPQLLAELQTIIDLKGRGYRYIRKALRKNLPIYIRQYRENDKESINSIFTEKDSSSENSSKLTRGMYYYSHFMYPSADLYKYVICTTTTDKIIGFLAFSAISKHTISSVASLFKPKTNEANIWGAYYALVEIYNLGYKTVNFGGNETEGSYNFIRRIFRPTEEIKKIHLAYDQ